MIVDLNFLEQLVIDLKMTPKKFTYRYNNDRKFPIINIESYNFAIEDILDLIYKIRNNLIK